MEQKMRGMTARGFRIRRRRRELGLTQEQLAEVARCDVKTVRNAEASRNLDIATLQRLSKSLGVEVTHMTDDSPDPSKAVAKHGQLIRRWLDAVNLRDVNAIMKCYDSEATLSLPSGVEFPGSGTFCGSVAIRVRYEQLLKSIKFDLTQMGTIGVQPGNNVVFFRGALVGNVVETGVSVSTEMVCEFQTCSNVLIHHLEMLDTAAIAIALGIKSSPHD